MADLKTLLDREARQFDLAPDVWDRTQGAVIRRRRQRRLSASLVALIVAMGGLAGAWVAFGQEHRIVAPGSLA